ncbi:MAG TPA: cysteine hydrolase [Solirubrobacteraceae bacterium]|jgi:ureidoacrylate peracid hydrolase
MSDIDLDGAVLMLMDMQNDFCHEEGVFARNGFGHMPAGAKAITPKIEAIAKACKRLRIPIVATKLLILDDLDGKGIGLSQFRPNLQEFMVNEGFRKDSWGHDMTDEFKADDTKPDYEVRKWGHSAMYLTELEKVLQAIGAKTLIFVGLGTNGVIEGTARDAVSRGYKVIVVGDCATAPIQELHEGALRSLDHLGKVIDSQTLLSELEQGAAA